MRIVLVEKGGKLSYANGDWIVTLENNFIIKNFYNHLWNLFKIYSLEKYANFIKLIKIGVPFMALRPKMLAEGLDPDKLSVRVEYYNCLEEIVKTIFWNA